MMNTMVDVGRVINREMKAALDARSNCALGFPVLITHLCHLAGVDVTCFDPTDHISLLPIVMEQMYSPGKEKSREGRGEQLQMMRRMPRRQSRRIPATLTSRHDWESYQTA